MKDAAERFTGHAAAYTAGRPTYPDEAIDFVLAGLGDPASMTVADLGSGTGISARLLAARGARVFAVEPNAAMREKGGVSLGVIALAASAERTGLPDASIDLATAFQAFHWFDRAAVFPEIARVLRPRGSAAAVYYERDESDAFTAAYGTLVRRFATDETEQRRADALLAFEQWDAWASARRAEFPATHVLDVDGFADRIRSTSYLPQSGPQGEALFTRALELFDAHATGGRVKMRLRTIVAVGRLG